MVAGYAQAEDRLEQLLQNYRLAAGTLAEIAGPALVDQDYRSRVWQHEEVARAHYGKMDPKLQRACQAFIAGVKKFMADHPEQVLKWAQPLEPHHPVMLSRFIIWNWPEGQAAGDLERGRLEALAATVSWLERVDHISRAQRQWQSDRAD